MYNLLSYAYESGICMALLYGIYWIFLKKETYFQFNRFYLLGTILFACLLPLSDLKISGLNSESTTVAFITSLGEAVKLPEVVVHGETNNNLAIHGILQILVIVIYLLGVSILLTRMLSGILKIAKLRKYGECIQNDGYTLVSIKQNISPFSFLREIYISESLSEKSDWNHVIDHELIHIRQHHTYDNLCMELFLAMFWFNPFVWLIRKALRNTHEYLADQGVKKANANLDKYQSLLLGQINRMFALSITNNFNSMIKKRIKMMSKKNSTYLARYKPLLIVPIALGLVLIFSCSDADTELLKETLSPEQAAMLKSGNSMDTVDTEVFFIVEEMPDFQGMGIEGFRNWIADNLIYPKVAERDSISGKVYVQFIVNSKGNVVDVKVVRGADPLLDAEAKRVTESSPAWKPGRQRGKNVCVQFTFPINFILD